MGLDPAELPHAPPDLTPDLGELVGPEHQERHHEDHEDLGGAERGHLAPFGRTGSQTTHPLSAPLGASRRRAARALGRSDPAVTLADPTVDVTAREARFGVDPRDLL